MGLTIGRTIERNIWQEQAQNPSRLLDSPPLKRHRHLQKQQLLHLLPQHQPPRQPMLRRHTVRMNKPIKKLMTGLNGILTNSSFSTRCPMNAPCANLFSTKLIDMNAASFANNKKTAKTIRRAKSAGKAREEADVIDSSARDCQVSIPLSDDALKLGRLALPFPNAPLGVFPHAALPISPLHPFDGDASVRKTSQASKIPRYACQSCFMLSHDSLLSRPLTRC